MRLHTAFAVSFTALLLLLAFPAVGNATSLTVGPTLLTYYEHATDTERSSVLVLYTSYAFVTAGTVDYFESLAMPGGNAYGGFQVMLLRPVGPNQYMVVASQSFDVPKETTPTLVEYYLSSPWTVQAGDIYAHFGNGIPFDILSQTPEDLNAPDPFYYPSSAAPLINSKITLPSSSYPLFNQPRDYGLQDDENVVPEPASLLLLGTGLGAVGLAAWRRKK